MYDDAVAIAYGKVFNWACVYVWVWVNARNWDRGSVGVDSTVVGDVDLIEGDDEG